MNRLEHIPTQAYACFCDGCHQPKDIMTEINVKGNKYTIHYCSEACRKDFFEGLELVCQCVSGVPARAVYEYSSFKNYLINPRQEIQNPVKMKEILSHQRKLDTLVASGRIHKNIPEKYRLQLMAIAHWYPS